MKKHLLLVPMALAALGLSACGDEPTANNVDTKANLFVKVMTSDQSKADSVKLTLLTTKRKIAYTDSIGVAALNDLQVGSYNIQVEKSGFAPMLCQVEIPMASDDEESAIAKEISIDLTVHKTGAILGGVAKITKMGAISDLKDAIMDVEARPLNGNCEFMNPRTQAETGSDGTFEAKNLPERATISVNPRHIEVDDQIYTSSNTYSSSNLVAGNKRLITTTFSYTQSNFSFVLENNNLDTLAQNAAIELNYSKSVDVSRIRNGDIKVSTGGSAIATNLEWSNNNRTLKITPAVGSTWPNGSLNLLQTLFSADDHINLSVNKNFQVFRTGNLAAVEGLSVKTTTTNLFNNIFSPNSTTAYDTLLIDDATTSLTLKWKKTANATGYQLYKKAVGKDSAFVLASDLSDTSTVVSSLDFSKGKNIQFMVVAYNSANRSAFPESALSLKDTTKAKISLSTNNSLAISKAIMNNAKSTPDTLIGVPKRAFFTEAMDTTKAPSITVSGAAADKMTFTVKWQTEHSFDIIPVIKANQDASTLSNFDVTVDVTGVVDRAGNSPKGNTTLSITLQ
jgi:hypothetical protein